MNRFKITQSFQNLNHRAPSCNNWKIINFTAIKLVKLEESKKQMYN